MWTHKHVFSLSPMLHFSGKDAIKLQLQILRQSVKLVAEVPVFSISQCPEEFQLARQSAGISFPAFWAQNTPGCKRTEEKNWFVNCER